MAHETILNVLSTYRQIVIIVSAAIPVVTLVVSFLHGVYDGRRGPWRHFYALMVHVTTLIVAAVGASKVYHIVTTWSLDLAGMPLVPMIAVAVGWLLTLGFVKRAVDFSMIRTVRNPFGLLISWLLGWAAAEVMVSMGFTPIPGPVFISELVAVVLVFLVTRLLFRAVFGSRGED